MDEFAVSIYCHELETQCRFALSAIRQVNAALNELSSGRADASEEIQRANAEIFRGLHSFLTHASNVSRLLWPSGPRRRKGECRQEHRGRRRGAEHRGCVLRSCLNLLNDEHPLKDRALRDHLEHFDERLDDWQATSSRRNFVQDYIGPPNGIVGIDPTDRMHSFDPATSLFVFRGESFSIQALATAVEKLLPLAARHAKSRWLRDLEDRFGGREQPNLRMQLTV